VTLLINPQSGLLGNMFTGHINISYVADTIFLFRFFEAQGRLRKALSILKNRGGHHEDTIRELRIDSEGVRVGAPLTDFEGIMTGTPAYHGRGDALMEQRE
jgi:circadian clock protein KaiC